MERKEVRDKDRKRFGQGTLEYLLALVVDGKYVKKDRNLLGAMDFALEEHKRTVRWYVDKKTSRRY